MKKCLLNYNFFVYLLGFLFIDWKFSKLYSQEELITDRLDQTESAFTVSVGYIQVEAGITVESYSRSYVLPVYPEQISNVTERNFYSSVLLRAGILSNLELRFGGGMSKINYIPFIADPLLMGFKLKLTNERKFIPNTAFLFHLSVPLRREHTDYVSPDFRLAFSHTFTKRISIAYNLGTVWEINKGLVNGKLIYTLSGSFDNHRKNFNICRIFWLCASVRICGKFY